MDVAVSIEARIGRVTVCVSVVPRVESSLVRLGLLQAGMPDDFYECSGFSRMGLMGSPGVVREFTSRLVPLFFAASGGLPLLWISSREHVRAHRVLFRGLGVRFSVLRGSLRTGNPFGPLVLSWDSGGSADEHILMLERL